MKPARLYTMPWYFYIYSDLAHILFAGLDRSHARDLKWRKSRIWDVHQDVSKFHQSMRIPISTHFCNKAEQQRCCGWSTLASHFGENYREENKWTAFKEQRNSTQSHIDRWNSTTKVLDKVKARTKASFKASMPIPTVCLDQRRSTSATKSHAPLYSTTSVVVLRFHRQQNVHKLHRNTPE